MNTAMFPQSSIGLLCLKLSPLLSKPPSGDVVSPEDLRDYVAAEFSMELFDQELITLLRFCSKPETADILISTLLGMIQESQEAAPRQIA
jgi:hypothetical protein